jgi:hypothetical protein
MTKSNLQTSAIKRRSRSRWNEQLRLGSAIVQLCRIDVDRRDDPFDAVRGICTAVKLDPGALARWRRWPGNTYRDLGTNWCRQS